MSRQPTATPAFKELDGVLFMAQQVWKNDTTNQIESCVGAWEWEQVGAVMSDETPSEFPPELAPICSLIWSGREIKIRADFQQVLTAYRRYKQRFGGQYIRLLAN